SAALSGPGCSHARGSPGRPLRSCEVLLFDQLGRDELDAGALAGGAFAVVDLAWRAEARRAVAHALPIQPALGAAAFAQDEAPAHGFGRVVVGQLVVVEDVAPAAMAKPDLVEV